MIVNNPSYEYSVVNYLAKYPANMSLLDELKTLAQMENLKWVLSRTTTLLTMRC